MDNPLAELDAWWDTAAPEDGNAYVRRIAFQTEGEGYLLDFETVDDADARAQWRLTIEEVEEVVWRGEWGGGCNEPEWHEEHPSLIPYRSKGALISFAKFFDDPLRAWGAVARAHHDVVKGWFPLERFFRTDLLESRFGMLASGPARLLNDYALALRGIGEEIGYSPVEEWSLETPLSVMTWGESYLVAHRFLLERIA